jgi:hypothetical protein
MKSSAQCLTDIQSDAWMLDEEKAKYCPRTDFGRKLMALRCVYIENGGTLLDEIGIEAEIRARRGGVDD